jgi:4-hydroxybenzoate polyprenyltransferase
MILTNQPLQPSAMSWSWTALADLIRLRNQSGTWLLMLPSLWSLVLATQGRPSLMLIGIFVLGAFVMRSLGVVLNDLADRHYDKQVTRTSHRPLADGRLAPRQAWLIALILAGCAAVLVLTLNQFTMLLSPIALFLAAVYPFSKRWIHIPQAVLGIAFGWGTIMAWTAARGTIDQPAWWLFGATVCWAVAYDTIYALQDRDDDRRIGVKSSALTFGDAVPAAVGIFLGGMVTCLVMAGQSSGLRMEFYLFLAFLSGLFMWQVRRLSASVTPSAAFMMFRQHVYAGAVVLLGIWFSTSGGTR